MRIVGGSKVCSVALGVRLTTTEPLVGGGIVAAVRPDTELAPLVILMFELLDGPALLEAPEPVDVPERTRLGKLLASACGLGFFG
jgi:hypothetical protein